MKWPPEIGPVRAAVLALASAAVIGLLFPLAGLVPIKASSEHWAVTRWFLEFAMERAVSTQSLGAPKPPPLDDPALVLRGAGHFEFGCKPCHGAPDGGEPVIPRHLTPHPPPLAEEVPHWDDAELFFIVQHGIKFTGMPAWPARHREDEVWAVVAFLRRLPELSAREYRDLALGPAAVEADPGLADLGGQEPPLSALTTCRRCHGLDGTGRGHGAFPRLDGQPPEYLAAALDAYAADERASGIMQPLAAGLTPETRRELARWYGSRGPSAGSAPTPEGEPESIARGRTIAHHGVPERGIPSCADCHGPGPGPRNPHYPTLAGQPAGYLVLQLELFKKEHRGGSPYARLMRPVVRHMNAGEMRDVAAYYASLER